MSMQKLLRQLRVKLQEVRRLKPGRMIELAMRIKDNHSCLKHLIGHIWNIMLLTGEWEAGCPTNAAIEVQNTAEHILIGGDATPAIFSYLREVCRCEGVGDLEHVVFSFYMWTKRPSPRIENNLCRV